MEQGQLDKAADNIEAALEAQPQQPLLLAIRGLVRARQEKCTQAIRDFRAAMRDLRSFEHRISEQKLLLARGRCHEQSGRSDAAIADYRQIVNTSILSDLPKKDLSNVILMSELGTWNQTDFESFRTLVDSEGAIAKSAQNEERRIKLPALGLETWVVAGRRVDPGAPGLARALLTCMTADVIAISQARLESSGPRRAMWIDGRVRQERRSAPGKCCARSSCLPERTSGAGPGPNQSSD